MKKSDLIFALALATKDATNFLSGNNVYFLTSAGTITGKFIWANDETDNIGVMTLRPILKAISNSDTTSSPESKDPTYDFLPLLGDEDSILLKDVVVKNGNSTTSMASMLLFTKDIIGITIGKSSS